MLTSVMSLVDEREAINNNIIGSIIIGNQLSNNAIIIAVSSWLSSSEKFQILSLSESFIAYKGCAES